MGATQGLLCVGGGLGLEGRAGKFSLVTVGGVAIGLMVDLGAVVVVGVLGIVGLDLAVLSASSLDLYRGQPL